MDEPADTGRAAWLRIQVAVDEEAGLRSAKIKFWDHGGDTFWECRSFQDLLDPANTYGEFSAWLHSKRKLVDEA